MKIIKYTTLGILAFLIVIFSFFFQLSLSLNTTIMSKNYFENVVSKENLGDNLSNIVLNSSSMIKFNNNAAAANEVFKRIDKDWLNTEMQSLVIGTQNYLIGKNDTLPIVNIRPFKSAILDIAIENALKENNRLGLKIPTETVKTKVTRDMKLNQINDTIDLNTVLKNPQNPDINIAQALRDIISSFKIISTIYISIILCTLIFLIWVIDYDGIGTILWQTIPIIISGLISVSLGLITFISGRYTANSAEDINLLTQNLINGFFKYLLICGFIFIIISALTIAIFRIIILKRRVKDTSSLTLKKTLYSHISARIILGIFLLAVLSYTTFKGFNQLSSKISIFNDLSKGIDFENQLNKAIGLTLLITK